MPNENSYSLKDEEKDFLSRLLDCQKAMTNHHALETNYSERNLNDFLSNLCSEYGFDMVATLIANHIKSQMWDGRYSHDVKIWASDFSERQQFPKENSATFDKIYSEITLENTHPVVVNFTCLWVIENEKNKNKFYKKPSEEKISLSDKLYNKMSAEQDKFRDWLLEQSPQEILGQTYEYTVREDILYCLEENNLSDEQAKALLKSPCPLADIYKDFSKKESSYMEEIRASIEERANKIIDNSKEFSDNKSEIKI